MIWSQKTLPGPSFPNLLSGFRIMMRPPVVSDWAEWQKVRRRNKNFLEPFEPAWDKDALTQKYFLKKIDRHVRERQNRTGLAFFIFKKENGALIGAMNINHICRGAAQYASLGYWLDEAHQGQGYMAEALRLTLKYGFENLSLHRIHAACIPENTRSRNLLMQAGFQQEGFAEKYIEINGRWQDHVLFGLTVESWCGQKD
jgi:ribosomal-protein-alanine N-acetyltransferase